MLRSRTTVRIMEQIMSGDNYQWIFSRQKEAIVIQLFVKSIPVYSYSAHNDTLFRGCGLLRKHFYSTFFFRIDFESASAELKLHFDIMYSRAYTEIHTIVAPQELHRTHQRLLYHFVVFSRHLISVLDTLQLVMATWTNTDDVVLFSSPSINLMVWQVSLPQSSLTLSRLSIRGQMFVN